MPILTEPIPRAQRILRRPEIFRFRVLPPCASRKSKILFVIGLITPVDDTELYR